jgi:hypothetical protein
MGLSFGGTSKSATGNSTSTPTYTGGQGNLQSLLSSAFSQMIPGLTSGSQSPNITAQTTANADTINKSYSSSEDATSRFLAARGFGQSGAAGSNAVQTNIARQGDLAKNLAAGSSQQLQQNQGLLQDALMYAFANPGQSASGTSNGSSSGWGASLSAADFGV